MGAKVPRMQYKQANRNLVNANEDDLKESIRESLTAVEARSDEVGEDAVHISTRLEHYDRLQAEGDPEYDFHFGNEGQTNEEATYQSIHNEVTGLSGEIGRMVVGSMTSIEAWQDMFGKQQDELHAMITELQIMVKQQAWTVAAVSEAVMQLVRPQAEDDPFAAAMGPPSDSVPQTMQDSQGGGTRSTVLWPPMNRVH